MKWENIKLRPLNESICMTCAEGENEAARSKSGGREGKRRREPPGQLENAFTPCSEELLSA